MPVERFHVRLLPEEGGSERVSVEVGMEGFNVMSTDGSRTLRKYPLHHIARWSMRGSRLILFTRSPVDVEDRTVTLEGDEHTIRSVLDTLTCCCMQMAELLQSGQGSDQAAANSLHALLKKSKKAATLPTADQVEFWKAPEKAGWMHSQGEHIKTWRKRWFVLKQGYLFRFASQDVTPSTKPRGIVDLSQVTDVTDGSAATGRPNSIKLSTATVSKCYLTDSETAQVEWISALEGAVARIVKIVAGVDDDDAGGSSRRAGPASLEEQLQRSFSAVSGGNSGNGSGGRRASSSSNRNQMVEIINYQPSGGAPSAPAKGGHASAGGYGGEYGYVEIDYGSMAGAQMAAPEPAGPPQSFGPYGSVYSGPSSSVYAPAAQLPMDAGMYGSGYAAVPDYNQVAPGYHQHPAHAAAPAAEYGAASGGAGMMAPGHSLMDAVTAPQGPPPAPSTPWQVHYAADGRPYYYNSSTGITTWEAPAHGV